MYWSGGVVPPRPGPEKTSLKTSSRVCGFTDAIGGEHIRVALLAYELCGRRAAGGSNTNLAGIRRPPLPLDREHRRWRAFHRREPRDASRAQEGGLRRRDGHPAHAT